MLLNAIWSVNINFLELEPNKWNKINKKDPCISEKVDGEILTHDAFFLHQFS